MGADGNCYLKGLKNDGNNTMTPIAKASATLCLKDDTRSKLSGRPPTVGPQAAVGLAALDCVQVKDTDTIEDEYKSVKAKDAADCCAQCFSQPECTHSVMAHGSCFLKDMRHNDGHNTMSPTSSIGATMCLKRYKHKQDTSIARADSAHKPPAERTETILVRLRLTDGLDTVVEDNWYWLPPKLDKFEMGGCFTGCDIDNL
jgi:hypothetical protein